MSKGSGRRPKAVTEEELEASWERTFGSPSTNSEPLPEACNGTVPGNVPHGRVRALALLLFFALGCVAPRYGSSTLAEAQRYGWQCLVIQNESTSVLKVQIEHAIEQWRVEPGATRIAVVRRPLRGPQRLTAEPVGGGPVRDSHLFHFGPGGAMKWTVYARLGTQPFADEIDLRPVAMATCFKQAGA